MDKNQPDGHLKKGASSKCGFHPTQNPKYYCSDSKCRALLCFICMKQHPKEHLSTITTIENVKSQTLKTLKNETLCHLGKFVEGIFKSSKMNNLFKEALGTLMQQNTTVDLDDEDVADILADTLQRKYFEMQFTMKEKIKENLSIEPSSSDLVAFDFEFEDCDGDNEDDHDETARKFCRYPPGYCCREDRESFYAGSKGQGISWSAQDQTLLCQDLINPNEWKKYEIPLAFHSLTVIDSEKLLFVATSENKLLIYSIENEEGENDLKNLIENDSAKDASDEEIPETLLPLKICKEFPQEEEILFLASDHVNHLFMVTEGESGLTATISVLKNQNNELELLKLISFEPFDLPKKVVFDHINNLLFILGDDFLEIYKYPTVLTAPLQVIFKIKAEAFSWHQATQRLLLVGSGKLYQLSKGKFTLVRVIMNYLIRPIELTNQGILCVKSNTELCLLSYKNPNNQKLFVFPSVHYEMDSLQEEASGNFNGFDSEVDPQIGDLETTCNTVKIALETPDYLVIYANVTYYQSASQKVRDGWEDYGGTIFTQRLIKYNFKQKEYQMSTEGNS